MSRSILSSQHIWSLQDQRPFSHSWRIPTDSGIGHLKERSKGTERKQIKLAVSISLGNLGELLAAISLTLTDPW